MQKVNIKHQRRNSELKKVIDSVVFSPKNAAQFANVYVTRLILSKDTKDCKVFFAYLNDKEDMNEKEVIALFDSVKKEINAEVTKKMRLKFVPIIIFRFDEAYYQSKKIEKIFEEIKEEESGLTDE